MCFIGGRYDQRNKRLFNRVISVCRHSLPHCDQHGRRKGQLFLASFRLADQLMFQALRIVRDPALGWETVAECENCAFHGDLTGCFECDWKGWRQLTEDEELVIDHLGG